MSIFIVPFKLTNVKYNTLQLRSTSEITGFLPIQTSQTLRSLPIVHLKVPDILGDIIDEGVTLDKVIPPGYVCSYNIRVQQDDSTDLMTKRTVLEDLTDPGYTGRGKIKAGLFYYEFDEENVKIPKEYDLLDYKCNIY